MQVLVDRKLLTANYAWLCTGNAHGEFKVKTKHLMPFQRCYKLMVVD